MESPTFIAAFGTTISGRQATLPAAQVFARIDDHGYPIQMPCISPRLACNSEIASPTKAIGCVTATSSFELLNGDECLSEYTYPAFHPDSLVQVFLVDATQDQEFARIVAPILHGVRLQDKQAVNDLVQLVYMTEPADTPFSLDFAKTFRERIFGRHTVRHGVTINMILEHFGLPKKRGESFKKAKGALGLTQGGPNRVSSKKPKDSKKSLPSQTTADLVQGAESSDSMANFIPERHVSPKQKLTEYWQREITPRGIPTLNDALLVAEYFAGDLNEARVIQQCLQCMDTNQKNSEDQYRALLSVFSQMNTDLENHHEVERALAFMKG